MTVTLSIDLTAIAACIPASCVCPCCCGCPTVSFIAEANDTVVCGTTYTKSYGLTTYTYNPPLTLPLSWSVTNGPCLGTGCLSDPALGADSGTLSYYVSSFETDGTIYYWEITLTDSSSPPCTYTVSWTTTVSCPSCPTDAECDTCAPITATISGFPPPYLDCINGSYLLNENYCLWRVNIADVCTGCVTGCADSNNDSYLNYSINISCYNGIWTLGVGGCGLCCTNCDTCDPYIMGYQHWITDIGTGPCPPTGTYTLSPDPTATGTPVFDITVVLST